VSGHAYILFYQKRGIDFDNIVDYDKIKNGLRADADAGQEKFHPEEISFPELVPEPIPKVVKA